jgi:putative inorganic carbon (hco3(-)) transporter
MQALNSHKDRSLWWVYAICGLFVAVNGICIANEFYWLNIVPPAVLILLAAIMALDKLVLFCVVLTPLSINLSNSEIRIGLSLPVEPILGGILFVFILRVLYEGKLDRSLIRHPLSIAIMLNLIWIFITCITSELPIVSFKYLVSRLWFVVPFYFVGAHIFRDVKNIRRFLWLYIIPLTAVIGFTLVIHAQYSFNEDAAHWVMSPFYNDHTAYGAALAMFYPALIGFTFSKDYSNNIRVISLMLLVIFTIALIFSYTRAAWVSLLAALIMTAVFRFKIQFKWIFSITLIVVVYLAFSWSDIMMKLEQNRQDTSDNLQEHLQSISNISTDASNLERLNRWSSAMRMFEERPIVGWGPGTYSFVYAPFQLSSEKTIISTNAGNLGNAHSEYIGPLCEEGILGALTFLFVCAAMIWTGWRVYYKLPKGTLRATLLSVFLGLITYLVHGLMNNFLDTDKASVPFWGFAAMLVAIDLWYKPEERTASKNLV